MLWQLLASALAHPLPIAADTHHSGHHEMSQTLTATVMADDCPHQQQQPPLKNHAPDEKDTGHACQTACKCPCASTPALTFVLPTLPQMVASTPVSHIDFHSLPHSAIANLLRPPIR